MRQNAERLMNYRARILCINPEPRAPEWLPATLRQAGYLVQTMEGSLALLDTVRVQNFDIVIVDLSVAEQDGLSFLRALTGRQSNPPVIVLANPESVPRAEECIEAGAYDCLLKPVSAMVLEHALENALRQDLMRRELAYLRSQFAQPLLGRPAGISAGWSRVLELIEAAASSDVPVLFLGESGVGKEDAARLLHSLGTRNKGPLVRVNCARLSGDLFPSRDFMPRNNAAADAETGGVRFYHVAHGGTLLMDEIGLLAGAAQAQVLHLLQHGSIETSGDPLPVYMDVRLVASSSLDLEAEAAAGRFSRSLLDRFSGATIRMPALRERIEDIPLLAAAFLEKAATRLRKKVASFHPEAISLLESYSWPGNVRELRNVIERAVMLADSSEITPSCLVLRPVQDALPEAYHSLNLRAVLAAEEKRTLAEALRRAHGVRREAARLLGIDPRNLVYFLRKYGLEKREDQ